ncbi:MAG: glycosyltransferase [Elainellaceae cyanobacterium]
MPNTPLRIALFTGVYAPFLSGVSIAVHQRVRWLLQQGHDVLLIHPEVNEQYPDEVRRRSMPGLAELQTFVNFAAYAYPTRPIPFYKSFPEPLSHRHWSDTAVLEQFQPDVIVVEEAPQMRGVYSLFLGGYGRPVGTNYARQTRTPIISLFHTDILAYSQYYLGGTFLKLFRPLIRLLTRQFTNAYDINYCPSRGQLRKYREMAAQHLEYLPYQGVDCQKFKPENLCYNPIPDDPRPTILFVGRIAPEKNLPLLLEAFPLIVEQVPDAHLVIVGSGPQIAELRERAGAIASPITLWGESMGNELLGWFARGDVFVNPSVTENFSTTNLEALASGTPVVGVTAPSTVEQIIPGVNGFLAKPNNPQDLADKVVTILKNPGLRIEMAQKARLSALEFDWAACMQAFESRLYELVRASDAVQSLPLHRDRIGARS